MEDCKFMAFDLGARMVPTSLSICDLSDLTALVRW